MHKEGEVIEVLTRPLTALTPDLEGQQGEDLLHRIDIAVNRNAVPFDPRPPMVSSGLRIGTPAEATRAFGDANGEQ